MMSSLEGTKSRSIGIAPEESAASSAPDHPKMDTLMSGWFSEVHEDRTPGSALSFRVKKVLHHERSKYQDILAIETTNHGRSLILDGVIQCTEHDEFTYQEMISFLPLCSHPSPKNVLIVGGGDGGVAREVAKHPLVEKITQVEIDASVLEVSRKYLPFMAVGFDHPKVTLNVGDGFEFMKQHRGEFDVIITDCSDPVGPNEVLYHEEYFRLLKSALKADGIVCSQGCTAWGELKTVTRLLRHCRSVFPVATYAVATVPSYPTGQIGFVLGSTNTKMSITEPATTFTEEELEKMNLKYYDDNVHRAAFVLPRFIAKELGQKVCLVSPPSSTGN